MQNKLTLNHSFCSFSLALNPKAIDKWSDFTNVSSIATQVFRNLFWKICPLFGQILITCLKCSRASFLPFSYSEKMSWGGVWVIISGQHSQKSGCSCWLLQISVSILFSPFLKSKYLQQIFPWVHVLPLLYTIRNHLPFCYW